MALRFTNLVAYSLCAALLSSCAASGVKVSEEQAESFKVGRSTYSDVVSVLGPPTTTTLSSDGTRTAIYSYSAVSSRPQNFLPYIGPFVSGFDTASTAVTFTFNKSSVLTATTSSQSNLGTGMDLAAGGAQPAPTDQPRAPQ